MSTRIAVPRGGTPLVAVVVGRAGSRVGPVLVLAMFMLLLLLVFLVFLGLYDGGDTVSFRNDRCGSLLFFVRSRLGSRIRIRRGPVRMKRIRKSPQRSSKSDGRKRPTLEGKTRIVPRNPRQILRKTQQENRMTIQPCLTIRTKIKKRKTDSSVDYSTR